jgi:hypothetical protein
MVVRLMLEQRKRFIASVLGHAEREFYPKLTDDERDGFRQKVFDAADAYTDFVRDILKVVDQDQMRNDRALKLIEAMHASQRQIVEKLGG